MDIHQKDRHLDEQINYIWIEAQMKKYTINRKEQILRILCTINRQIIDSKKENYVIHKQTLMNTYENL